MKTLILISAFLTSLSCQTHSILPKPQKNEKDKSGFYKAIKPHFNYIDSIRRINADLIEDENKKLKQTLEVYQKDIFDLKDSLNRDLIFLVKSLDNKLCLISWDTRLGGTMIDFVTMAIYKTFDGNIHSTMLTNSIGVQSESTLMHYDNLYTIQTNKGPLYIAHGFGQGSSALPWQELKAFQIKANQLLNPEVFTDKQSSLFLEFDTHQLNREEIPMIQVLDSGKTILFPMPNDKEGFSGKYQTITFNDSVYNAK